MKPNIPYIITTITLPEFALFGYTAGSSTTNTGFLSCNSISADILCFSIVEYAFSANMASCSKRSILPFTLCN